MCLGKIILGTYMQSRLEVCVPLIISYIFGDLGKVYFMDVVGNNPDPKFLRLVLGSETG